MENVQVYVALAIIGVTIILFATEAYYIVRIEECV